LDFNGGMKVTDMLSKLAAAGAKGSRSALTKGGAIARSVLPKTETIDRIREKVKIDHPAALELWASGRQDARVLATMIADARKVTTKHIDDWRKDLTDGVVAASLGGLAARGSVSLEDLSRWCDDPDEWTSVIGWSAVANRVTDERVPDSFLRGRLEQIRVRAGAGADEVSAVMADVLARIGLRPSLLVEAIETADAIIERWDEESGAAKRTAKKKAKKRAIGLGAKAGRSGAKAARSGAKAGPSGPAASAGAKPRVAKNAGKIAGKKAPAKRITKKPAAKAAARRK